MDISNRTFGALLTSILVFSSVFLRSADVQLKEGDILFQESQSSQRVELKIITRSKYTHTGILFKNNGSYYVLEAIQPVTFTPLRAWINRGKGRHYVVKRLKNAGKIITPEALERMRSVGREYLGKNYDIYFQWSDQRMYCSELVWKIYKKALGIEIARLQQFKDFDLTHPLTRQLIHMRYGGKIPLEETVIAPSQIFDSDKLKTVFSEN